MKKRKKGKLAFLRILLVMLSSYCIGTFIGVVISTEEMGLFFKILSSAAILTEGTAISYQMAKLTDELERLPIRKIPVNEMEQEIMEAYLRNKEAKKDAHRSKEQEIEKGRVTGLAT